MVVTRVSRSSFRILSYSLTEYPLVDAVTADKHYEANKLATFAVVLGIIYAVVTGIEAFGVMAAISQRLWMARIYALLSVGSALAAVAAGFMRVIVHFTLKNDLINECTRIATGDVVVYEYGFWGPTFDTKLSAGQANDYCKGIWSHDSAVEIISLIIEMLLAAFFCMLSFAYYHQLLDPTSAANVTRRPGPAAVPPRDFDDGAGAQGFPSHYNPPYLGYDAPAPARRAPPVIAEECTQRANTTAPIAARPTKALTAFDVAPLAEDVADAELEHRTDVRPGARLDELYGCTYADDPDCEALVPAEVALLLLAEPDALPVEEAEMEPLRVNDTP
ncbi:hypothetical protein EVJ58_g6812 [Rhodofomes roseus]|uniref:Uncharacterized protein n=1 Tax=Rhodofomes roseus TaxID=34475 RepID=A0A4Y9Y887_9APHY|nr:hypothetical protein EVJ58_g6812 [Rhodofomes roseus]